MRTTIVLLVIAVLMLAFILVFERGSLTSTELAQREGRVLGSFVRKRVSEIEIVRGKEHLILHRDPDPDSEDGALGIWHVTQPMQAQADEEAVDILLGELEWMDARRRLESISPEDRERFGLDAPAITVRYQVGSTTGHLKVGGQSPMKDGYYVQADDPNTAYVVGKDLFEALDHPAAHYHTKELHEGLLLMTVRRMELERGDKSYTVEKRADRFWVTKPVVGWASRPALDSFVDTLDGLRAKRFITSKLTDEKGAEYGFGAPRLSAAITKKTMIEEPDGDGKRFEERTVRFRLGAACGDHEGESYFMVGDEGPVMCVADEEIDPALDALDGLREKRLLPLPDEHIAAVEVTEGKAVLRVTKAEGKGSEGKWEYALKGGGGSHPKGVAEEDAVSGWFAFLRAAEAIAFDQGAADGPLGPPAVRVRFELDGDKPAYVLAVFDDDARLLVRRGDEPQLTAYPKDVFASLRPSISPFRSRRLLELDQAAIVELRVVRGKAVEVLTRGEDDKLRVVEPVQAPADGVIVQEVLRMLAGLEVLQFIADAPAPEHGLATPDLVLEFKSKARGEGVPARHRLLVGAQAVGGNYGQLDDDPTVFIVPSTLVSKLASPLISRTYLAVPLTEIDRIALSSSGGEHCALTRREGAFAFEGEEPSDQAADLAEALATLRAQDVGPYGTVPAPDAAKATLRIQPKGDDVSEIQLLVGTEGEDGRVAAWRASAPVTFSLGRGDARALTGCPKGR